MKDLDYFAIVEQRNAFLNPTSSAKLDALLDYCGIEARQHLLDVGCGKGWLLRRAAERAAVSGLGIDLNPSFVDAARRDAAAAGLSERLQFRCCPAVEHVPEDGRYDVAFCIGASFAIGEFEQLLPWLTRQVRPGGVVAIGDIFARTIPLAPEVAVHFGAGRVRTLTDTALQLDRDGLTLVGIIESSRDDWDRYESSHWLAVADWAARNPEHPDRQSVVERTRRYRHAYLTSGRETLGWALFVSRLTE